MEKQSHSAVDCKECAWRHTTVFGLKKNDVNFLESVETQAATWQDSAGAVSHQSGYCKNKITLLQPTTAENVPDQVKQQIIKTAIRKAETVTYAGVVDIECIAEA